MLNNLNENFYAKQANNLSGEMMTNLDTTNLEYTSGTTNYFNIVKLIHDSTFNSKLKNKEMLNKNKKELAIYYKDEGNKFFLRKEYEIAIIYFSKAIENDQEDKLYFSNRAACHLAQGNFKLALTDSIKCIEIDPNYSKGYYRACLAYYEMNKLDDAIKLIEVFRKSSSMNTDDITYLLENIQEKRAIQIDLKSTFPSFEKYLTLCNWLLEGNSHFSKLDIHFYSDNHRGVVAKNNIYKDEIILKIPKDLLISIELAKATEMGAKIANFMYSELNSPKHSLLTSFILNEIKNPNTKWRHYLDILPKDYSSFPIFYTDEELKLLEGSPFLIQVLEKKEDMKRDYHKICNHIPEFSKFEFREFCEIRMAVSSRIFGVKIDYKKTDVLAPFADLLNHKRPRTTHWYYDEMNKAFFIQSLEDIPIGQEVYDSYGKKCNSRFLLNYGFIIDDNDANEFSLCVEFDENYPLFKTQKSILKSSVENQKKFRISENILDCQVIDFFSYLRYMLYDENIDILNKMINENYKLMMDDSTPSFYLISPLSVKNELNVLKRIQEICTKELSKYTNSLADDEDIIRKERNQEIILTNNFRNCIIMRWSEKKILNFYLRFARYCEDLFRKTEKEIIECILRDYPEECPFEFYVHEVVLKLIRYK